MDGIELAADNRPMRRRILLDHERAIRAGNHPGLIGACRQTPLQNRGEFGGMVAAPTITPAEAMLFDLQRIARKAAAGLPDAGAPIPRGFRSAASRL